MDVQVGGSLVKKAVDEKVPAGTKIDPLERVRHVNLCPNRSRLSANFTYFYGLMNEIKEVKGKFYLRSDLYFFFS